MFKILYSFMFFINLLPVSFLYFFAWILGKVAYLLAFKRRKIGEINLALCFPEKTKQERTKILKDNFYHAACMLMEYSICWYASPQKIKKLVQIENLDILEKFKHENIQLTILYPHFYALELGALRLNLEYPIISIFTGQKNPFINKKIYQGRTRFNSIHPVHLIRRNEKIISIIHRLKKSKAWFLYLPDQDFGKEDSIFVPFFKIPTATTSGVSRISRLTYRKVLPIIPIRSKNKITLKIFPLLDSIPSPNIIEDTKEVNLFIEKIVRQYPEQYFWLHKRFKTRPEGENSVY